jgi:hypothetical protein
MIYLLLIVPHIAMIAGLLAFAYYSHRATLNEDDDGGTYGTGAEEPPRAPQPLPSGGDLPLSDSTAPRRRLRVGERLFDLHPRRLRREHAPAHPQRKPVRN